MKKFMLSALLTLSVINTALANTETYYALNMMEDCVSVSPTIKNNVNWYNIQTVSQKLVRPAIYKTNNPDEKADMTIYELQKLAGEYYQWVITEEDLQIAKDCDSLKPDEIQ